MIKYLTLLISSILFFGCRPTNLIQNNQNYKSESLEIKQIAEHVYLHTSWLEAGSFGKVLCNGMIVLDKNETIVFDTPANDNTSLELINWIENTLKGKVKAIISTHFHEDCLGGLEAFYKQGISSYAHNLTLQLARQNKSAVPQNGFDNLLELKVGNKKVFAQFFGEGHTEDNVIGYFPDGKIIFGGCLIKEVGAAKGNLADANTQEWPLTVAKLKAEYPEAKIVIPGHGKMGGTELFDYTVTLFEQK